MGTETPIPGNWAVEGIVTLGPLSARGCHLRHRRLGVSASRRLAQAKGIKLQLSAPAWPRLEKGSAPLLPKWREGATPATAVRGSRTPAAGLGQGVPAPAIPPCLAGTAEGVGTLAARWPGENPSLAIAARGIDTPAAGAAQGVGTLARRPVWSRGSSP